MERSWFVTMLLPVLLLGCAHQADPPASPPGDVRPVSTSIDWTARGKLLVQDTSRRRTLRFTWKHLPNGNDEASFSDSLGLQTVTLLQQGGLLMITAPDGTLTPVTSDDLGEDFRELLAVAPSDFARALAGHTFDSPHFSSQAVQWQNIDGINRPRVLKARSVNNEVKIVISDWDFANHE